MKTTLRSFVANSSLVAALAMLVLIGGAARADVIKPVGATGNPQGYPGRLDVRTVDGSGLSSTTMPTDPDAGPWPTHTSTPDSNMWLAYPKSTYPNPTISFDLGAAYILSGAHVWNYNENLSNRGCRNVDVYVSNDNATWGSAVATWELGQASGDSSYTGENKSFPPPTQPVRYVKFVPTSDWGGDSRGLSEVRFITPPPVFGVVLTGPTNNQALSTSTPVTASATVVSYGTPPYTVRFFLKQGEGTFGQAGGDVTASPYLADLGPLAAATYQIYATVTDSTTPTANNATSATHTFTVGDLPPTVAITSPAANSSFPPGTAIVIDATASDDYSVTQVDFYADGSLIGTDSSTPYGCSWSGAAEGVHSLTAVATDSNSQTTTSAAVAVRVVIAPLTINLAPSGTASDNLQTHNRYNDLTNFVGNDPRLWFGIKWTSEQLVSALYLQAKLDDYPTDFVFQVANPGVTNPNLSTDTDWTTPDGWTFAGNTNNHPSVTSATPLATYAVRVKATSADQFASSELLVLKGVSTNVAPDATRGGLSGWAGTASRISDGVFMNDQQVTIQQVAPPPLTFDWATPQTLGGIMVAGGAGSYPTSYDVEYQDGSGNWQTAVNVWGNTKQISVAGFTHTTSQHFRVKLTGTSDNTYQRVSEIMLFTAASTVPASGFAGWIGTGGYDLTGADAAVDFDYDGDGFDNGVEYVLGTDPTSPNGGGPVAAADGADFVFTFQRALASKTPDTTVVIDVGTDLVNWPGVYPVDSAPEVTITPGAPGYETVTLRVPRAPDTNKFARMRVTVTTP
jgi:hypothetical protein